MTTHIQRAEGDSVYFLVFGRQGRALVTTPALIRCRCINTGVVDRHGHTQLEDLVQLHVLFQGDMTSLKLGIVATNMLWVPAAPAAFGSGPE